MKFLFTLLMVLGVFAGLNARALALDCGSANGCCDIEETRCVEAHDSSIPQEKHHEGDGCPVEHHHHLCCSHGITLGAEELAAVRLGNLESRLPQLRPEGHSLPEDPFLGSEKPPLI